jgi:hypothetical protein
VRQRYPQKERYNAASGWLHAYGCALDVGRPPACYEFICNAILDAQPTAYHKYIVKVLSFLVSYLGRNCCGHRHLVELNTMESLLQVNYERFSKRLSLAEKALHECADFLHQSHYSFSPHCATKILASGKSAAYVTQAARSVSA